MLAKCLWCSGVMPDRPPFNSTETAKSICGACTEKLLQMTADYLKENPEKKQPENVNVTGGFGYLCG